MTTTAPASPFALIIPCPPGTDPDQLLAQLIDAAADAGEYRERSADPDCSDCTRNPAAGKKTLCGTHQAVEAAGQAHDRLYAHLTEYASTRAGTR